MLYSAPTCEWSSVRGCDHSINNRVTSRGDAPEGYVHRAARQRSRLFTTIYPENLLRGIYAYGYESPSAVQSRAIVQICKGRDTIAQAQSGTGKTATFSISVLQVIDTAVRETQGMPFDLHSACGSGLVFRG